MTAIHKAQNLILHFGKENVNEGKGRGLGEKIDNRLEKSLGRFKFILQGEPWQRGACKVCMPIPTSASSRGGGESAESTELLHH